ncbi:MAG: DNA mismatch repair endonuclease MutL [Bacteroidetes bacterium]|nr:DNA mismatch repair endonuclease MutL [Bacteroidota bacterium]
MQNVITLLPDSVANQIAAGEVVQRPASIVKELMENAIDAGASHIKLIVKDAGKTLVQVIDNGVGMSPVDARMAFERHATSKIKKAEDLFSLHTKGFRGEALASIAAVAQVELKTKRADDTVGQLIEIEGNKLIRQEECQAPTGSSFTIKNLFYNIPARRNFLKEDNTELKHIIDEFERVALPHPDIHFQLYSNGHEIFNLPAAAPLQRIMGVFGNNQKEKLVAIHENTDVVKIEGYVGKPAAAKKKRGDQYFFVNDRFIKSPYLNHAVYEAYKELISSDTHPAYYLFLSVPPDTIDINIHPTKTEIKFRDEKTIYALLHSAVKRALGKANLAPSLDFNSEMSFEIDYTKTAVKPTISYNPDYNPFKTDSPKSPGGSGSGSSQSWQKQESPLQQSNKQNWETLYESYVNTPGEKEIVFEEKEAEQTALIHESVDYKCFQLYNKYIVTSHQSGVLLIDQQRAHERILYEHYLKTRDKNNVTASQQSLFPVTLELSPNDFALIETLIPHFKLLGFDIEPFGKNTMVVQGTPADLGEFNVVEMIEGILETYKLNTFDTKLDPFDNMCRSMARNASIKYGKHLEEEELKLITEHLFACENPMYSPSGKPILMEIEKSEIDGFFKK